MSSACCLCFLCALFMHDIGFCFSVYYCAVLVSFACALFIHRFAHFSFCFCFVVSGIGSVNMSATRTRKSRSANFTAEEEDLIIELANKHHRVLENKVTNAVTVSMKNNTWNLIAIEFNARCPRVVRSSIWQV